MTENTLKVLLSGVSDIGMVREENQDALLIHEPTDPETLRTKGILLALADGMGGLEGGSTASKLAVEAVLHTYYGHEGPIRAAIEAAVYEANQAIYRHSNDVEGGRQMGSTLTAVVVHGRSAWVGQVGDSRAYRYYAGTIEQVTRDHSLLRELIDRGEIDEQSALVSAHRNILTRGLGLRPEVTPDIYEIAELRVGDAILVSSDGLHGLLQDDELSACLERFGTDTQAACSEMVRVAKDRGGPDNITVAVAYIEEVPDGPPSGIGRPSRRVTGSVLDRMGWLLPLIVFVSFVLGVVLTLWIEGSGPGDARLEYLRGRLEASVSGDDQLAEAEVSETERLARLRDAMAQIIQSLENPRTDPVTAVDARNESTGEEK